jgi:hypothetical protein
MALLPGETVPFASLYLCLAIIGAVQARLLAGPMPVVSDYGETQAPKCERIFICGACGDAKRLHKKESKRAASLLRLLHFFS